MLLECGNAAARRPYRQGVVRLRTTLDAAGRLIAPTDQDAATAWEAYARGESAGAGIVDHISFAVMRRLGIRDVFTNDRHFQAASFHTLF